MKTVHKPILLLIFLFSLSFITPVKTAAQYSMSYQGFYDDLSPYGEWVDNPDYGYVWVPDVSDGFAPYGTNGYWVFTDAGWTWMSYYEWGWAPFHYGRWYHDPYYGYAWIPGNEWGPGWVTWRRSEGYYGWAPIGPNISIDIAYGNGYSQPYNQWRFVRDRDFGRTNIYNYYIGSNNNNTIINNSIVINNIHDDRVANVRYNTGPERTEVQRHTGNTINPVSLKQRNRPGQNLAKNELEIYRPKVERSSNDANKPAPVKVTNWNNGKPEVRRDAALRKQNRNNPTAVKPAEPKRIETIEPKGSIGQQPQRREQPVRTEPVKQKPVEPKGSIGLPPQRREQPVRTEPVKQKPVQQQPQRTEQPPQRREQPVRTEPVKQKPVQQPPQRREQPVRTEPVKQKPVQQQPQRTEQPPQRREQPVRTEPVKQRPVQQPPQRTEQPPQRKEQPGRTEPVKQRSVQSNGFVGQPSLSPTSKDEPMKQPPAPKKGRGTAGATANDMPLNPEPARNQHFDVPGRSWPTKPMRTTAPPRHPSGD